MVRKKAEQINSYNVHVRPNVDSSIHTGSSGVHFRGLFGMSPTVKDAAIITFYEGKIIVKNCCTHFSYIKGKIAVQYHIYS